MTDVYGCTGWGKSFCKSVIGNMNCLQYSGVHMMTGCEGAAIEMDIEPNLVTSANTAGDRESCMMRDGGQLICNI